MTDLKYKSIHEELLADEVEVPDDIRRKANWEKTVDDLYKEMQTAVDKRKRLPARIGAFIRAENKAGRKAGAVLDAITLFLPFGKKVDTARDAVRVLFERKNNPPMKKVRKWLKQPSSKAGLVVITAILAAFGVNISPEMLGDNLNQIVEGVSIALAGSAGLYEAFRNEKSDEDDKEDS